MVSLFDKASAETKLYRVWNPRRNRSSFSYQEDYSFKEEGVRLESALPTPEKKRCLPKMLDSATRDKIFKLVLDILPSEQDIPTFPSEAILACAMEAFFIQETETLESMMTPNMFCLSTARPELILAIIAAGSVTANNESLRKMGRAFQDVARIAVAELVIRHVDVHIERNLTSISGREITVQRGIFR